VETGAIRTASPARQSRGRRYLPSKSRKARCWRAFAIRRRSLNSQIGKLACHFGKSLRPDLRKLPFSGDSDRRLGSIATAARGSQSISRTDTTGVALANVSRWPIVHCMRSCRGPPNVRARWREAGTVAGLSNTLNTYGKGRAFHKDAINAAMK
jgi:hypothetical protein